MQVRIGWLIALLALVTLATAQDHSSHAVSGGGSQGTASGHSGGSLSVTGHIATNPNPNGMPSNGVSGGGHPHGTRHSNGYSAGWGSPVLLPYDGEYDQLEGRGTFNQGQEEQPQDDRRGPTIFEHNGQPSREYAVERSNHQERQREQSESSSASVGPPTVLIFRDGHQQEIANYAITGSRLIVLGEKTEKIQLSDLDLGATLKANQDRGIDFKMPAKS